MLKGCIQLGTYPEIGLNNYINMMPVDGVARICVAAAASLPEVFGLLNARSRTMGFEVYLSMLEVYGYDVQKVSYDNSGSKETRTLPTTLILSCCHGFAE
jgi:thioester reductase-like protein